jgi:hypothetical protein
VIVRLGIGLLSVLLKTPLQLTVTVDAGELHEENSNSMDRQTLRKDMLLKLLNLHEVANAPRPWLHVMTFN